MAEITEGEYSRKATCGEELLALRDSLEVIGGKWKLVILKYLAKRVDQDIHFSKMLKEIDAISAKMLSKELKELEVNLLITRAVQDTKPVTVCYKITPYANTVLPLTETLIQWGIDHRRQVIGSMEMS